MSSSFDAPQDRPGRHRLVHQRTRTLTPPRAAGFLVAATLTVLGITAAHQALSNTDAHEALSAGQGAPSPGPVAGQVSVPSSAYDNSPTPDAPDAPTPARLLAQSTPNNQPQPGNNAASTPSRQPVSHAATGSAGTPAQASSNGAAAQTATPSSPASQPASTSAQPSSSSPPASSSTPPAGSSRSAPPVLSQVVGTVTGVLGGL